MGAPAIEVENVSFAYGDREAVKGISFDGRPGEVLGFLGPNGAGKSTTIKILTGQLRPRLGHRPDSRARRHARRPRAIQARIGVCFEEKNLYERMTAEENLRFFGSLCSDLKTSTDRLLERVGLADRAKTGVAGYSKGMRQRLMVARSLVNEPRVLFLDEPTDGLDPVSSKAIRGLIREEAERGAAVLLTTHDMWEADELSDRVAFINEGALHASTRPRDLKLATGSARCGAPCVKGARSSSARSRSTATRASASEAVEAEGLLTIHTEEATLESIFIQMTGRGLETDDPPRPRPALVAAIVRKDLREFAATGCGSS
jgi:ABC-type multidrug transport system ATPase subunit